MAITETFTSVKAVKAPKLMNDVEVATSRKIAIRPIDADDHQVSHRGVELLAEPAEDRLGQDGVAAHRVQQAGGAGLRGEAGGELRHDQAGQEHGAEQLPADLQGDGLAAEAESSNTPPGWTSWVT